jgi:hypothetical protein
MAISTYSGTGESGYGFRDTAGAMEVKDDGTHGIPLPAPIEAQSLYM